MISAYKQECLRLRFEQARHNLQSYIVAEAKALLGFYRINGMTPTMDAPSSFEELKAHYKEDVILCGDPFKVYDGGMEDTLYPDRHGNHCFRFVHDMQHLILDEDFTYAGEVAVAQHQIQAVVQKFGVGADEVVLMEADTLGQLDYFHDMGGFVPNQRVFVWCEFVRKLG